LYLLAFLGARHDDKLQRSQALLPEHTKTRTALQF